jgi:hypothetical protein
MATDDGGYIVDATFHVATLGLSWNFSLAGNLASLSFLKEPASQPPGRLSFKLTKSQQLLIGSYSNFKLKLREAKMLAKTSKHTYRLNP